MKQKRVQNKGIEGLFRLLGGDPSCGYQYGMFTSEGSPDSFFRISFMGPSFLGMVGIDPDLVVVADGSTYTFPGIQDYDESGGSWFFRITEEELRILADALDVQSVSVVTSKNTLFLFADEPLAREAFFRAAYAGCIGGKAMSYELLEFCVQRMLAPLRNALLRQTVADGEARSELLSLAVNPELESVVPFLETLAGKG